MNIKVILAVLTLVQLTLVSLGDQELPPQQATEQAKIFYRAKKFDLAFKMASRGDMNDPANLTILGSLYYMGNGVDQKDVKRGIELWEKASKMGNAGAAKNLARFIYCPQKKYKETVELLKPIAEKGDAWANYTLGGIYMKGLLDGVKAEATGLSHYRKAALECPDATGQMIAYYGRLIWRTDPKLAVDCWEKGAEKNDPYALLTLGEAYMYGWCDLPKDNEKAKTLFDRVMNDKTAAAGLVVSAAKKKIELYEKDEGCFEKEVLACYKAIVSCKGAAQKDVAEAFMGSADMYRFGKYGATKNDENALAAYTKAAELGCADAWARMGYIQKDEDNSGRDENKAKESFEKAVAGGSSLGVVALADYYLGSWGNDKNLKKAEVILLDGFKRDPNCEHAEDIVLKLFDVYEEQQRYDELIALYKQYLKRDYVCWHIHDRMVVLLPKNVGVTKDMIDVVGMKKDMCRRSEEGDGEVTLKLSEYLKQGIFGEVDEKKASNLVDLAAQQGDCCAAAELASEIDDAQERLKRYKKVLELNPKCLNALTQLAFGYFNHDFGEPKEGVKYLVAAAETGDVSSRMGLGNLYLFPPPGYGIEKDVAKGKRLLTEGLEDATTDDAFRAAGEGVLAYVKIVENLEAGNDASSCVGEFEIIRKYAEEGYYPMFSLLAACYQNGWGIKRDEKKAQYWKDKYENFQGDPNWNHSKLREEALQHQRDAFQAFTGKISHDKNGAGGDKAQPEQDEAHDKTQKENGQNKTERKQSDSQMGSSLSPLRGLGVVASSPIDVLFPVLKFLVHLPNPMPGVVAEVEGCAEFVGDVVLGTADILTLGWLGNKYFYNSNSWNLKPGFFGRMQNYK